MLALAGILSAGAGIVVLTLVYVRWVVRGTGGVVLHWCLCVGLFVGWRRRCSVAQSKCMFRFSLLAAGVEGAGEVAGGAGGSGRN